MSVFDRKSRYVKYASLYVVSDSKGRQVEALTPAAIPPAQSLGLHRAKQDQRLDHLSAHYLNDPFGFWCIAAHNDVMTPDVLAEVEYIDIPSKG